MRRAADAAVDAPTIASLNPSPSSAARRPRRRVCERGLATTHAHADPQLTGYVLWMRRARSVALACLLLALVPASGCTCGGCYEQVFAYPVSDSQIERVLSGTPTPTRAGCQLCGELRFSRFGVASDGGPTGYRVDRCSLSGHELTCVFIDCAL